MEFGKLESVELYEVDFSLPEDSLLTKKTLSASNRSEALKIYVGCTRWGHKGWTGRIYPPKINEREMLKEYSKHFNSIELNATFYSIPKPDDVKRWSEQVEERPDFRFSPKLPQSITNARRLKNGEELSAQFFEAISHFADRLGPISIQLSETFSPKSFENLENYLSQWPAGVPVAVELRHKNWFQVPEERERLFETLHKFDTGTVITDVAGRRDCAHMELTTPHAMVRFVGNDLHKTDYERADNWVKRIKSWREMGLKSLWFFVHEANEDNSPAMAEYFIKQLNQELGTNVQPPALIQRSASLF